jgi:cytochrome c5
MGRPVVIGIVVLAALGALANARAEAESGPSLSSLQAQQYQTVCSRCHARPETGAPIVGDVAAWEERRATGFAKLLEHTIDGWQTMPPLGTCGSCSEADFRALVAYVSGVPDPAEPAR